MKHNRYDETFKSEAVKLALSSELSYAQIAQDLGVNHKTLRFRIRQTMDNPKSLTDKDKIPTKQDHQALECQELDLRKKRSNS